MDSLQSVIRKCLPCLRCDEAHWTRYTLLILSKNCSVFAVNLFVSLMQLFQLGWAYNYKLEQAKAKVERPALLQP